MPEILTQHPIPPALHRVNLRLYWGSNRWKKLGRQTREEQDFFCIACGRKVPHKDGDWLELHENFTYDCENEIATINSMVCLCRKCHDYIHIMKLDAEVREGKATQEYAYEVSVRGDGILAEHNLEKQTMDVMKWRSPDWKLLYEGQDLVPLLREKVTRC